MNRLAMSREILRRSRRLLWAAAILTLSSFGIYAQDPDQYSSAEDELLTMLLPERITLPIGDRAQRLEVSVYVPHNYDPQQSYPLLVVLDADPLLGLLKTLNFLWAEERKSVPVILVGVPFGSSAKTIWTNRSHYLLPKSVGVVNYYGNDIPVNSGGGASDLAELIHNEMLPNVFERYNVDRNRIGLAGFSMGGLFTAWHFVMYPEMFTDYLIIAPPLSPPFIDSTFERATKQLQQRGMERSTRLYVAHGENDLEYVLTGASQWASGWQELDDTNLTFRFEVIAGHHHDAGAIPALISGYEFLYAR